MALSVPLFCFTVDAAIFPLRAATQNNDMGCRVITRFVPQFPETGCKAGLLF